MRNSSRAVTAEPTPTSPSELSSAKSWTKSSAASLSAAETSGLSGRDRCLSGELPAARLDAAHRTEPQTAPNRNRRRSVQQGLLRSSDQEHLGRVEPRRDE